MIPISDINPAKNTPIVSRAFIIIVALVYFLIQPKTSNELFNFFYEFAAIQENSYEIFQENWFPDFEWFFSYFCQSSHGNAGTKGSL